MATEPGTVTSATVIQRQRMLRSCAVLLVIVLAVAMFPLAWEVGVLRGIILRDVRPGMSEATLRARWGEPKRTWKHDPTKARPWWTNSSFTVTGSALLYTRIYFFGSVMVIYVSPGGIVERVDLVESS